MVLPTLNFLSNYIFGDILNGINDIIVLQTANCCRCFSCHIPNFSARETKKKEKGKRSHKKVSKYKYLFCANLSPLFASVVPKINQNKPQKKVESWYCKEQKIEIRKVRKKKKEEKHSMLLLQSMVLLCCCSYIHKLVSVSSDTLFFPLFLFHLLFHLFIVFLSKLFFFSTIAFKKLL